MTTQSLGVKEAWLEYQMAWPDDARKWLDDENLRAICAMCFEAGFKFGKIYK